MTVIHFEVLVDVEGDLKHYEHLYQTNAHFEYRRHKQFRYIKHCGLFHHEVGVVHSHYQSHYRQQVKN